MDAMQQLARLDHAFSSVLDHLNSLSDASLMMSTYWTCGTRSPGSNGRNSGLVRVQRRVLGERLRVFDHTDDLERDAAAFLDLVDRDGLAALESGSTAHVSTADALMPRVSAISL